MHHQSFADDPSPHRFGRFRRLCKTDIPVNEKAADIDAAAFQSMQTCCLKRSGIVAGARPFQIEIERLARDRAGLQFALIQTDDG